MKSIESPSSRWSWASSSRICAWIVTSSAVVGSSATSSSGLFASAMAIITRWRCPPESWCGQASSRASGSRMPTRLSSSIVRSRAGAPVSPWWIFRLSPIWRETVCRGLSEVIGSWKTKLMSLPRTS